MTVKELKEKLNEMPDKADVWMSVWSDWSDVASDGIEKVELVKDYSGVETVWLRGRFDD